MTKIIVDDATEARLAAVSYPVDLCDKAGHLLGKFTPSAFERALAAQPPISEEELRRREQEGGRPLADILADLQKRP